MSHQCFAFGNSICSFTYTYINIYMHTCMHILLTYKSMLACIHTYMYVYVGIHVSLIILLLKYHVYKIASVEILGKYVNIYAAYEPTAVNNVTRSTGMDTVTLLAHAIESIFLPYSTHMFHCTVTLVYTLLKTTRKCNNANAIYVITNK